MDDTVAQKALIDLNGDAVWDMDPSQTGSGFLARLNGRAPPASVRHFAITGVSKNPINSLISRAHYQGEGDGVVSKTSQLGTGVLTLAEAVEVNADHSEEPAAAVAGTTPPLLRFLEGSKPVATITAPDPKTVTELQTATVNIKGTISNITFPADALVKIEAKRDEDGKIGFSKTDKLLYPSDLWNPTDPNTVVAEFDEPIKLDEAGTYTISVTVTTLAGLTSDVKMTKIKLSPQKPIINIQSPEYWKPITERRPTIKARIYSLANVLIDLQSIELLLDGKPLRPTIAPEIGGPDVTVSYTPSNDLSINDPNTPGTNEGKHLILVRAKDRDGLASEAKIEFYVFAFCPPEIARYMRAVNEREKLIGLRQTEFKDVTGKSFGTPDGGASIPSLESVTKSPFDSAYLSQLQQAIKQLIDNLPNESVTTGTYWDAVRNQRWTFATLYQTAMKTSGSGLGLNTWTHTPLQMQANGVETIDVEEIRQCLLTFTTLRLPMSRFYTVVDFGWQAGQPDGIGDSRELDNHVIGDSGWDGNAWYAKNNNASERVFFGVPVVLGLKVKEVTVSITVTILNGDPTSLDPCHLGHFVPNFNAGDFEKAEEARIGTVPTQNGTHLFTVTPYFQRDIDMGRKESWYKGWFAKLTDGDHQADQVNWWPISFLVKPDFKNP